MGNKEEKKQLAKQLGTEGQQLMNVRKKQDFVMRERDLDETRRMHTYQAAAAEKRANNQAMLRQQAAAATADNVRLAENQRRNQICERVRVDLKEETEITRNKYKIQSSMIR